MEHILEFEDSYGRYREIARFECEPEESEIKAMEYIRAFCDERSFHIYYTRINRHKGYTWFDVGSHTEFFHLNRIEK